MTTHREESDPLQISRNLRNVPSLHVITKAAFELSEYTGYETEKKDQIKCLVVKIDDVLLVFSHCGLLNGPGS